MGRLNWYLSILFVVLAGLGCSNSDNAKDDGNAKTKEQALSKLSSEHRNKFERWQKQVIKSCDASEAFGIGESSDISDSGVDGAALINKNNGSVVFREGDNFLILTGFRSLSGTSTTKAEESRQVNGKGYSITAETKRVGSSCTVYLYGQKVFETYIAESFVVGNQWGQEKIGQSRSSTPQIRSLGDSGLSEVIQTGVFGLITNAFAPKEDGLKLLSNKLGLSAKQVSKFFKLGQPNTMDAAVRIDNENSAVWSDQFEANFIAEEAILKEVFELLSKPLSLELRLPVPRFDFIGTVNKQDAGTLHLVMDLDIQKEQDTYNYSTNSVSFFGLSQYSKEEGLTCVEDRAKALIGSRNLRSKIYPGVMTLLGPCQPLHPMIEQASYDSGLMRELIPLVLRGVSATRELEYSGWDHVLSKMALDALHQGKDIRTELDPSGVTSIVGSLADYLELLNRELAQTQNKAALKNSIYTMGMNWALSGQRVSASRMIQIIQAVDNSVDPFRTSTESLLMQLGKEPQSLDDQLTFALSIDSAFKMEASRARTLSRELEYIEFERNVFNHVIQDQVRLNELKTWIDNFNTIGFEIKKYPKINSLKSDLVGLSVHLLTSEEVSSVDLGAIYSAIDNAFEPFNQSTRELVRSLSQGIKDNQSALDFAQALNTEYKNLAKTIFADSVAAGYESWGNSFFSKILQNRPSLEQLKSWKDMWSEGLAFSRREEKRTKDEFGSSNKRYLKEILDRAIEENWGSAEFKGLESIASLAKYKNVCDRHKGLSSLAHCGGMSLFSKKEGKYFDPSFGRRYIELAKEFSDYMSRLKGQDWMTLRWNLVKEFFGSWEPIWAKCDNQAFTDKAESLKSQVHSLAREKDQFEKWELERKIKETLQNCR